MVQVTDSTPIPTSGDKCYFMNMDQKKIFWKLLTYFFKENKLRICALLKKIQRARSLARVHKTRKPLHISRVKKTILLVNW